VSDYVLELTDSELARYTRMAETARRDEGQLWATAGIVPGAAVADIGCGPGAIAVELAEIVGPSGSVVAVDQDENALRRAAELVTHRGLENVTVREARADATGIEASSVDTAVIRHVLAHNGGREQAIIDHAASRLRPGGRLLVADVDLTAHRLLPNDPDLVDLHDRYLELHRARGNDVMVGLRLGRLLAAAGLEVIEHRGWYNLITVAGDMRPPSWVARDALVEAGLATADDIDRWSAAFERLTRSPEPLIVFVAIFAAVGRRASTPDA
jgi:precorrin-6B methylase 2